MRIDHHESPASTITRLSRIGAVMSAWVVDCDHLVIALPINHVHVTDGWIQSLSYERQTGRLEIHFTWNDVRQFWPVAPTLFRELWRGQPMDIVLHQIISNRRIRWAYVRTEGKIVVSMLKGLAMIVSRWKSGKGRR